jgi:hypothetical protein
MEFVKVAKRREKGVDTMNGRKMIRGALAVLAAGLFVAVALPVLSETVYAADVSGYIQRLVPSESMAVETGAGDTPYVELKSSVFGNDTNRIESLLPSESIVPEEAMGGGETPRMYLRPTELVHDNGHDERLLPSEDQ